MLPSWGKHALSVLGGASSTARSSLSASRTDHVIRKKFPLPLQKQAVEVDWQRSGFHCGVMVDPPGHEWNNYTHDCNELVTVQSGQMRFTLLDQIIILEPGDELFIPAGVPHSTKNIASSNTTWLYGYDGAANSWF